LVFHKSFLNIEYGGSVAVGNSDVNSFTIL